MDSNLRNHGLFQFQALAARTIEAIVHSSYFDAFFTLVAASLPESFPIQAPELSLLVKGDREHGLYRFRRAVHDLERGGSTCILSASDRA